MPNEKLISDRRDLVISGMWAFAEATFFFIVPDVWLTRIALRNLRRALIASLVATGAAVAGGTVMFAWGRVDAAAAERVLNAVPAISPGMIAKVHRELEMSGSAAIMRGPFAGVPYKIYAVEAGRLALPFMEFLAWSWAARLSRFLLLTIAAGLATRCLKAWAPALPWIHAGLWIAFYGTYFLVMEGHASPSQRD